MAKKKQSNNPESTLSSDNELLDLEVKKMTPAQYWEWRCTIEELKSSELNFKRVMLERQIKELEIELRKKELILFKEVVINASSDKEKIKKDYESFKTKLEEQLGCSLSNCVIDDITYEIKDAKDLN